MSDIGARFDAAEEELLILEEDLVSTYSNSGGPAENDLRTERVREVFDLIAREAPRLGLSRLTEVFTPGAQLVQRCLRGGDLQLDPEKVEIMLLALDAAQDVLESLESTGEEPAEGFEDVLERLREIPASPT
jgi:chemotaxis protein histidine kinase CheA